MWHILLKNRLIFLLYLIILLIALTFIILEGKINSHIIVTGLHLPILDSFFRIVTLLGDGFFVILIGHLLMMFINIRCGMVIMTSFLLSSFLVQMLKRLFFSASDRPALFFQKLGIEVYKIPGMEYHDHYSFPSGHATSAFVLFIGLALFSGKKTMKALFLYMAVLVAFSRVYLSQHFIEDIITGSLLGTFTVMLMYLWFSRWKNPWLDKRILKLNKQR